MVGLDGACWGLIDEWIEKGELPNIKKLRENGVWGDLKSSIPPITCPAWKCYSTGKNPGKLGVYWWNDIDIDKKEVRQASAKKFKSKEIWDYLNEQGMKTGIIGMPLTYPPKKVKGFMISGGPDAGTKNYFYPLKIKKHLKDIQYRLHPEAVFAGEVKKEGKEVEDILKLIELRFRAARILMDEFSVRFLQVTTFYLNSPLQHFFYKDEPVKRAWKLIDEEIGKIKDDFEYIILMSDHGTSYVEKNFFLNAWLKKEGYLFRKKSIVDYLNYFGINIQNLATILDKLHIKNILGKSEMLRKIGEKLPEKSGVRRGLGGEATLKGVNWNKTKVIALPQGPIYINRKALAKNEEYEELRDELISKLKELQDPENGKSIFADVYKSEEVYKGPYLSQAPDLVALDSDEYHNRGGLLKQAVLESSEWKGNNARYGLFTINGPGIKKGKFIKGVRIFDLAPTILHLMGCPIPKDMDGKVLETIFETNSRLFDEATKGFEIDKTTEKRKIAKKLDKLKNMEKI